jgi:hypothetical protein
MKSGNTLYTIFGVTPHEYENVLIVPDVRIFEFSFLEILHLAG